MVKVGKIFLIYVFVVFVCLTVGNKINKNLKIIKIDAVKRVSTNVLAMLPSSGYKTSQKKAALPKLSVLYSEEGSIAKTISFVP